MFFPSAQGLGTTAVQDVSKGDGWEDPQEEGKIKNKKNSLESRNPHRKFVLNLFS